MNTTRRLVALMMAALMLLTCLPAMAAEEEFNYNADLFALMKYTGEATEITVPATIGGAPAPILYDNAFSTSVLKKLESLTLSEGITQMRSGVTSSAKVLTSISLPSTLEVIGRRNFYQADALTAVTIPAAVVYVGQECFSYSDNLTSVTFTGLCPFFGANCFKEAASGLVVYVPDDQLDAYKTALPEGVNIQPSGKNAVVARTAVSESDFTFDAATGTITGYTGTAAYVEIPATIGGVQVKSIGKSAMFKHPYIVVVTLPEGLEKVEVSAFGGAIALSRIHFPSTIKTIEKSAFTGLELDQLVLPEGLETIGDGAFSTTFALNRVEEIVIPNSVTTLGDNALLSATATRIVIGENVQSIGSQTFAMCNNLSEIVVLGKNPIDIAADAFNKCPLDCVLTLPADVTDDVVNHYVAALAEQFPTCKVEKAVPATPAAPESNDGESAEGGESILGDWTNEYGFVLSILEDGTLLLVYPDETVRTMEWSMTNGVAMVTGGNWLGRILAVEDGMLIAADDSSADVYTRGGAPAGGGAVELNSVPGTVDDFIGGWICSAAPEMKLLLLEDGATLIDGDEVYDAEWSVVDGVAVIDGMNLYLQEDYSGVMDLGGQMAAFERGYVEAPKAPANQGGETPAAPAAGTGIGAEGEPFVGVWNLESLGGLSASTLYMTSVLTLNADGTLTNSDGSGVNDGFWFVEEGIVRILDMPATLDADGKMVLGAGSSNMVYVREGGSQAPAVPETNEPTAPAAPAASSSYIGVKLICKTYTVSGFTSDASLFGAEVLFKEGGKVDVTMYGTTTPDIPYTVDENGVYTIDWFGAMLYTCTPTEIGLDMDYSGMILHLEPAQ